MKKRKNTRAPDDPYNARTKKRFGGIGELLGEEFVRSVTSGEQAAEDLRNEEVPEEVGGPFVEVDAQTLFDRRRHRPRPQRLPPRL